MQLLEAPFFRDEFGREPVEKFRVGRRSALHAEVVLRLHDATTKILLPDSIHDDACGERILRTDDPFREVEAIWQRLRLRKGVQHFRSSRRHFVGRAGEVAFDENGGLARLWQLLHHHGGDALIQRGVELLVAVVQLAERTHATDASGEEALVLCKSALGFWHRKNLGEEGRQTLLDGRGESRLPGIELSGMISDVGFDLGFDFLEFFGQSADIHARVEDLHRGLVLVVEESEEAVVLLLLDGVELVIMALRTADAEAEPDGAGGGDSVKDAVDSELLFIDAAFLIDLRVAVKSGGDFL